MLRFSSIVRALRAALLAGALSLCCAGAAAQGLLWQAQRGQSTLFLAASIHVCDASCYPFPPTVLKALQVSEALAVELDPERENVNEKIAQRGFYPPGQSLRPLFDDDQYQRLESVLDAEYKKKLSALMQMRPWLFQTAVSIYAAEKVGLDSSLGIDLKLMEQARTLKKPVRELETIDEQLQLLEVLDGADPAGALKELGAQMESGLLGIQLSNLVVVWKRGDAARLEAMLDALQSESEKNPAFQKQEQERNQRMAQRILQLMHEYRTLTVVVGAAHFLGPGNLLTLLQAQGYEIRRLPTDVPPRPKK
ncbi:MAG: TraB/GumN family protein [Burkholderiaceae bacterium]|nr:MAG: TraB/GumN family protein [Burkholderiaceae bacterium]